METLRFYRVYGAIQITLSEVRQAGMKYTALEQKPGYREWQAPEGLLELELYFSVWGFLFN